MKFFGSLLSCLLVTSCQNVPEPRLSAQDPPVDRTRPARFISAFFGLDNAMPPRSVAIWSGAPGQDGMPLVFSHEIDPATLDPGAFLITTKKGRTLVPGFATFRPALEEFELRTILLIGEFGNAPDDVPLTAEITGHLRTRDGQDLMGRRVAVTPLEEGPFISYAEHFTMDNDYPYLEKGQGCDCPRAAAVVVRTVWSGGVRALNGKELGAAEAGAFIVALLQDGDTVEVHPFHIADVDDNDNNIDLCLREAGIPIHVQAAGNIAIDPRDDPNAPTGIDVVGRWE